MSTAPERPGEERRWLLRLYVSGETATADRALRNLRRLCREHLGGDVDVEVVDLQDDPEAAERDRILAVPTVVRIRPEPARRVIGDLSDARKTLDGLAIDRAG